MTGKPADRPLSPHLQIYRWQWTMALSILHRASGIALAAGTLLLLFWLLAAAAGPEVYARAERCLGSWIGRGLLLGWSFALFFHLANGIRHLFWDMGRGFELKTAERSAKVVIAASILLTIGAWLAAYAIKGAF